MMNNPHSRTTPQPLHGLSRIALSILFMQIGLITSAAAQAHVWQPCNQSLVGKTIFSLHLCPTGTILAGSSNGNIFRSTDDGGSWTRVRKGWAPVEIGNPEGNSVRAFAEKKDGTIIAGTAQGELVSSTDDGRTWNSISTSPYNPDIRDILIGEKEEIFIAAWRDGILRALPSGNGWGPLKQVFNGPFLWCLARRPGEVFVGTSQQGAYRSTDGGNLWSALCSGLVEGHSLPSIHSMVVDSSGAIVAVTSVSMFFLKRGDTTWTLNEKNQFYLESLSRKGPRIVGMSYAPGPFPTFAESVGDIRAWKVILQQGLPERFYKKSVTFTAKDQILVGGDIYGIYRTSDDGRNWNQTIKGLTNDNVLSMGMDRQANILYAGTLHEGLFRSTDEGATWTNIGLPNSPVWGVAARGPYIYALGAAQPDVSRQRPDFLRSDDGGKTWSKLSPGPLNSNRVSIALGKKKEVFLATREQGIFFSPNSAEQWESRNDGLPGLAVYEVVVMKNGDAYAATAHGVFRSTNFGKKWHFSGLKDVKCTTLAFDDKNQLFVGTDSLGIYSLNGYQDTWKKVRFPLTEVTLLNIDAKGTIVAGEESKGLYRSHDGGKKWLPYSDGLPQRLTFAQLVSAKKALFVASLGDGIFKTGGAPKQTSAGSPPDTATHSERKRVPAVSAISPETDMFVRYGHADQIRSIAFSPDGALLASASADKTIRVWDVAKGKQIRSFVPTDYDCFSVAFSPDGKSLWGGGQQNLWVWDVATGNLIRRVTAELGFFKVLRFSQDGNLLATGQGAGMIQLWNPKTFTVVKTLQPSTTRETEVTDFWFLDSAKTLLIKDVSGRLRSRNIGSSIDTIWHVSFPVATRAGYVKRDGTRFAAVTRGERQLVIWDCDSSKIVTTIDGVPSDVLRVAFAADGDLVLTAERNDTLEIWSRSTGALLQRIDLGGWGETMVASPTGTELVTASGKELRFWSLHWPNADSRPVLVERFRISGIAAKVQSLAYTNSDHTITFARSDSNISRFKITNRPTMTTWKTEMPLIQSIAVSPSKPILAALGRDYSVALWDTRKGSKLRTLMGGGSGVVLKPAPHATAISPNGALLACVQPGPNTKLWNLATAASGATLAGRWRWTQSLAFSPDNTLLAVSGNEGFITLWNTKNQVEIRTLRRSNSPAQPAHSLSFDPGGKMLACATVNGWVNSIDLWDVESGNPIRSLTKNVPYVRCISLAKSVKASLLASGHEDGSIRIWDYSNETKPILLSGHGNLVSGLTFAVKGSVLISSSEDGTIKLWESQGGAELATIFIFEGNDWAATTPEGYFDGTREGMKRVVLLDQANRLVNERAKLRHRKAGLLAKILESRSPR